jgi:hypothetical protein
MSESRLPIHPYAAIFPPMTGPEFKGLCRSIARDGLDEPIVLYEGKILDGRSRYDGCLVTKVAPRFRDYAGECGSPLNFVVSKNLHRRHLTEGQPAMVAAKLVPLFEEEARQRQGAALKQGAPVGPEPKEPSSQQGSQIPVGPNSGQPEKQEGELPVGPNLGQRGKPEENELRSPQGSEIPVDLNSGQPEKQKNICRSAQQAAALMKVSRNSVNTANRVQKQGVPQLVDALAAGKVSVSTCWQ